ncbi:MAG: type II toxin-antitoxin system prevent-host-death family antitoxin [Pseudomonadota bacterium]
MDTVGIRELKKNLSEYLRRVKAGQQVVVTDRKSEIALIVPYRKAQERINILQLVSDGTAVWSGAKPRGFADRIPCAGNSVSEAVLADRR